MRQRKRSSSAKSRSSSTSKTKMKAASPQKDASPSTVATRKKMQQLERHIQRLTFPCILYFVALYSVVCAANLLYYKSQVLSLIHI